MKSKYFDKAILDHILFTFPLLGLRKLLKDRI